MLAVGDLGRRLQLIHAAQWLYAADGDPYAQVVRGFSEDPYPSYEAVRRRGPLWRSRTGALVTAHHRLATELLDFPGMGTDVVDELGRPLLAVPLDEISRTARDLTTPSPLSLVQGALVEQAAGRAFEPLGTEFDFVAEVAQRIPVTLLADRLGLSGRRRARLVEGCADAGIALDGALCPQRLEPARRMAAACADIGALFAELAGEPASGGLFAELRSATTGGDSFVEEARALGVLIAGAWVPVTTSLISNTVLALLDHPGEWPRIVEDPARVSRAVDETLRYSPPVQLQAMVARTGLELAGVRVEPGDQVVVLVGAANRDPGIFPSPERFDPDRHHEPGHRPLVAGYPHPMVVPLASAVTEVVLRGMAARFPRLRRSGPVVRRLRAPVTRGMVAFPVSTA